MLPPATVPQRTGAPTVGSARGAVSDGTTPRSSPRFICSQCQRAKPAGLHYCCTKCRETNGRRHTPQCDEAHALGTRATSQTNVYGIRTKTTAIEGGARGSVTVGRADQPPLQRQRPSPRPVEYDDPRTSRSSRGSRADDYSGRRDDRSRTGEGRRDANDERMPESRTPTPRSSDTESRRDARRDDGRRQDDRRREDARRHEDRRPEDARRNEDRRREDERRSDDQRRDRRSDGQQQQPRSRTERGRGDVYDL